MQKNKARHIKETDIFMIKDIKVTLHKYQSRNYFNPVDFFRIIILINY